MTTVAYLQAHSSVSLNYTTLRQQNTRIHIYVHIYTYTNIYNLVALSARALCSCNTNTGIVTNTHTQYVHTHRSTYLFKLQASARNCTLHYSKINITVYLHASLQRCLICFLLLNTHSYIRKPIHTSTQTYTDGTLENFIYIKLYKNINFLS